MANINLFSLSFRVLERLRKAIQGAGSQSLTHCITDKWFNSGPTTPCRKQAIYTYMYVSIPIHIFTPRTCLYTNSSTKAKNLFLRRALKKLSWPTSTYSACPFACSSASAKPSQAQDPEPHASPTNGFSSGPTTPCRKQAMPAKKGPCSWLQTPFCLESIRCCLTTPGTHEDHGIASSRLGA